MIAMSQDQSDFLPFGFVLFLASLPIKSDADFGVCIDEGPDTERPRSKWQR